MALTPTLFIGLGSNGSSILKKLREYIHATYLTRDELPIFQFLVIETAPEEGESPGGKNWQFFRTDATDYNSAPVGEPELDWLPNPIPDDLKTFKWDAGSGLVRMSGRLNLWQNWGKPDGVDKSCLRTIIDEAYVKVKLTANTTNATNYLTNYYMQRRNISEKNLPKPIVENSENSSRVFVVGTFCGGTASGMLWDICCYLRSIMFPGDKMGGEGKRLQGIFTIPDKNFAGNHDEDYPKYAANTWAALHELDYWSRATTTHEIKLPGRKSIKNDLRPFDHFLLISPSNSHGRIAIGSDKDVIAALNENVALYLFCQTIDQFQGRLQQEHVDWPDQNGLTESKRLRFLSTFGLSGVLFPKYNIAAVAACLLGNKVCEKWTNEPADMEEAAIKEGAATRWTSLFKEIDSPDKSTNKTTLDEAREFVEAEIKRTNSGGSGWDTNLESSVEEESKKWRSRLKSKVNDWESNLKSRVTQMVIEAFNRYDNFPQTATFINGLMGKLSEDIENAEKFPTEEPKLPNIAHLLMPVTEASSNLWIKLAGKQQAAIDFHRSYALRKYREDLEKFIDILTNYLAKTAINDLHDNLDKLHSLLTDKVKGLPTIISGVSGTLETMRGNYTNLVTPPNVRLVTSESSADGKNGIKTAAQTLCKAVSLTAISDTVKFASIITKRSQFASIITKRFQVDADQVEDNKFPTEAVAIDLRERFLDHCIDYLDEKSNLATLIKGLGQDEIRTIESAADPCIEWTSSTPNVAGAKNLGFLFGSAKNNQAVLDELKEGGTDHKNRIPLNDTVDHMVLFYDEFFGFAIDDTAVSVSLEEQFENQQKKQDMYSAGRFTHKDGLDFFDTGSVERKGRMLEMLAKIDKWATVAIDIVPQGFSNAKGELLFRFTNKGIVDEIDLTDPEERKRLISSQEGFDEFIAKVNQAILTLGNTEATKRVNDLTQPLRDKGERKEAREKGDFYHKLFGEIFPSNEANTS